MEATTQNASQAISAAKVVGRGGDLALDLGYATKADNAYPIILVTYEIACDKGNKKSTLAAVKSFLTYTASKDGQKILAEEGYAPLPTEIADQVRKIVPTLS